MFDSNLCMATAERGVAIHLDGEGRVRFYPRMVKW
jgi:hypothetical protein